MTTTSRRGSVLPPSTILQNRYRVVRLHDRGGSATVYLAERLGVEESVPLALKELNPDVFGLAEFKNEVNVLYSLNHPNLPKVYDFFEEEGKHYLVMDFVQGRTLKERVLEDGPLPEDQALECALQVCDILSYLHDRAERKIIHRDLKPSNLMLTKGGQVKLLDFGIARIPESRLPGTRLYAYTEDYASPEQKANLETDERSDIYSFGVTLHFALTGATPAAAATGRGRLSREMRRIVSRCLRAAPGDRYQSFAELARDIRSYRLARRTRLQRLLWGMAAVVAVGAVALAAKLIFAPSLYLVVGPDRVEAGTSVALQVGLPAAWSGSLDSIVWQVVDTQAPGAPRDVQRGRYFSFGSTELGVYQIQACLEEDGRRRPLSEVKHVEVYPGLDVPGQLLAGQALSLWSRGATAAAGREYSWTWEVRGPIQGGSGATAPLVARETTSVPRFALLVPAPGRYSVLVSATVRARGGLDVTVTGDRKTFEAVTAVAVDPGAAVNQNWSFEAEYGNQPTGWVLVYPAHVAYDRSVGRTGGRSVRFGSSSGPPSSYVVGLVPLEAGQAYRLTAWFKGEAVAQGSRVSVAVHFRSSVDESYVMPEETSVLDVSGTFDWRQVMLYFVIPRETQVNLEVYLRFSGSGTVWFDDCLLEKTQ